MDQFFRRCRPLYSHPGIRALLGLNVLLGLAYSFVVPFMSMFGTIEVGMSPLMFGVFMTVTTVGTLVIGTALAHYSDTHFSRRFMLLCGSACGIVGYVGFAYLRDVVSLILVGTLVLGVSSISFSQLFAHAREVISESDIPEAEIPFYTNVFRMFFALAWTVGPALGSLAVIRYSYRGLFLCAAGTFFLFMVGAWRWVPSKPPAGMHDGPKKGERLTRILARKDLLAHFIGFVVIFAAGTITLMNIPLFVLKTLQGTERQVGIVFCVAPFFEMPFMLYFGLLVTRSPPARIIRMGLVIAVLYYLLLSLVRAPWQIYPLQVLTAATTAVTAGVAISYFQSFLPGRAGAATNLYASAQRIGSTLGYLLFGALVWGFGYRLVFVACLIFTLVSLALMYVPSPGSEEGPQALAKGPRELRGTGPVTEAGVEVV